LKTAAHEDVYQYAHNIKGTGASYGFKNLSELGAEICGGIKAKKFDGIQEKLENIGSVIDSALLKL
jgi:hypothetical protein